MSDILSYIESGLMSRGFDAAQTSGITAGIYAESGGNPTATNPTSGAYGIGQWLGSRQQGLFNAYGANPSIDQQLDYLTAELKGGDPGGKYVTAATTPQSTLQAYITKFMRPAAGAQTTGDLSRGNQYLSSLENGTFGDWIAKTFGSTAGSASNAVGSALAAPGNAVSNLFGGLDPSQWFQRIAIAVLAILLIGIALFMVAGKSGVAVISKSPVPLPA